MDKIMIEVKKLVSSILDIPLQNVNDDSTIDDHLEWDSLKHLQIIIELEQRFKLDIPISSFDKLTSIQNINEFIKIQGE
jgi:acyl carrier protein